MLAAALIHDDVIIRLGCLVHACREAVASGEDLAKRYMALRTEAVTLNEQYGWATSEEFGAQLPTLESMLETESLGQALGRAAERGTPARLTQALTELAGWATGLRLAYETLRDMDSRQH